MNKNAKRRESALKRLEQNFAELDLAVSMNTDGLEDQTNLLNKRSIVARDVYNTAKKLKIQDEYKSYLMYFFHPLEKKQKTQENPNDMRSCEEIDAHEEIIRDLVDYEE